MNGHSLKPGQIHIWKLDLEDKVSAAQYEKYRDYLSSAELERAERFVKPEHGRQFVIIHAVLRELLAGYLAELQSTKGARVNSGTFGAKQIVIDYNQYGKPYLCAELLFSSSSGLTGGSKKSSKLQNLDSPVKPGNDVIKAGNDVIKNSSLHFNISHSHKVALLAFGLDHPIGVDVEYIRSSRLENDVAKIAERFFAPAETEAILALEGSERILAFYRCWTRKEAFIKAIGQGLSFPLQKFTVSVTEEAKLLADVGAGPCARPSTNWQLASLLVEDGYVGAVCEKYDKEIFVKSYKY